MWNLWYLFPWCNNYIYILDLHNFITSWSFVIFSVYFHVSIHMSACVYMFVRCMWSVWSSVHAGLYTQMQERYTRYPLSFPPSFPLFLCLYPLKQDFTLNFLAMQVHRKFQEHFYMAMGVYLCFSCLCSTWSKPLSHFFSSTLSFNKSCQAVLSILFSFQICLVASLLFINI